MVLLSLIGIGPVISNGAEPGGQPTDKGLSPFEFVLVQYEDETHLCKECAEKAMKTGIPNLLRWLKGKQLFEVAERYHHLKLTDEGLFNYPMLFIEGHYDFKLGSAEEANLKAFLERGGFLFADAHLSSGGKAGYFWDGVHNLLTKLLPDGKWEVLPVRHPIYEFPFSFPTGLSLRSGKPKRARTRQGGEAFGVGERMMAFYSDADCCCSWSSGAATNEKGFMMAANVISYAMTH